MKNLANQNATVELSEDGAGLVVRHTDRNPRVAPSVFISREDALGVLADAGVEDPTITSVAPATGAAAGGTAVQVWGTHFGPGAVVEFDGEPATDVVVVGPTLITCTTPAHAAGAVDVVVTVGTKTATEDDAFTYA